MITTRLSSLTVEDVPLLERVETVTGLSFWGSENYIRFLRDFPEYFGTKATVFADSARGQFAGFLLARSIFENLEILKVGVWPEFHRRGIGTLLMKAAYAEGIRRGCERCFLEVRKSNRGAIDFYLAHKFVLSGVRRNYYVEPVEDALIMERSFQGFGGTPQGAGGDGGGKGKDARNSAHPGSVAEKKCEAHRRDAKDAEYLNS